MSRGDERPEPDDEAVVVPSRVLREREPERLTRREVRERAAMRDRLAHPFRPRIPGGFGRRTRARTGTTGDGAGVVRGRVLSGPLGGGGSLAFLPPGPLLAGQLQLMRLRRSPRLVGAFVGAIVAAYALLGLGWAATSGGAGVLLGLVTFGALVAILLAVPALGCSAVAGDRDRGVLPVLQLTALSSRDLVLGAWLAAAGVGVLGLAACLPAIVVAAGLDDAWLGAAAALAALVTAICSAGAVGVFAGAVLRRGAAAGALTQVLVATLAVGTLIGYAVVVAATPQTVRQPVRVSAVTLDPALGGTAPASPPPAADEHGCVVVEQDVTRFRSDRAWPLLALNPFVTLADSLGTGPPRTSVIGALSDTIRGTRQGPGDAIVENCPARPRAAAPAESTPAQSTPAESTPAESTPAQSTPQSTRQSTPDRSTPAAGAVWPFGVVASLLLTLLMLVAATRRLHTPQDRVGHAPGSWRARLAELPGIRTLLRPFRTRD